MQANRKYIYVMKKHPFTSYPAAKHQNAAKLGLQTYDKTSGIFYRTKRVLALVPEIILLI